MELKIETNQAQPRNKAIIYQAIGWVTGNYQPSADNPDCGVLVTQDGVAVPAQLKGRLHHQLKKKFPNYSTKQDLLPEDALWTVYPSTEPLKFELVNINTLESIRSNSPKPKRGNHRIVNGFRLVGQIESVANGSITIVIRRNEQQRKGKKDGLKQQPFVLQIVGSLPAESVGQIWELEVQRQKATLVLSKGYFVRRSVGKPKLIEQKQENACRSAKAATDTSLPESKPVKGQSSLQTLVEQSGKTNPQAGECAAAIAPQQTDAKEPRQVLVNVGTNKTVGKITVVVKLNEFPDDVKTVDKGGKEFEIDTGGAIVTISLKPKDFDELEQAQQIYPSWVAAISGQMSKQTATGFRLESAAIKVFERKDQGSFQSEGDTKKHKASPSPTTSSELPSTTLAVVQPQHIRPQRESLAQPLPNVNNSQLVETLAHFQKQPQNKPAIRKKQPLSTAQIAPASKQPSFSVKVNERVFVGHDSVTLNKRVLTIDGKPVAQGKLAVVVGKPCAMSADGSVTQGNNQAVLMSK